MQNPAIKSVEEQSDMGAFVILAPPSQERARQALFQATKGILRKVNKLALTALRLAASRKESTVGEALLLDATTEALL